MAGRGRRSRVAATNPVLPTIQQPECAYVTEYRDLITQLKTTDRHFLQLFDKHNALDQQIKNIETHIEHATHEEVEVLKKQKLLLKDQMYAILKKAESPA